MLHLSYIKNFAPLLLYILSLFFVLLGFFGRGQWSLLLLIFLIPLRNVIEKIQDFPLGSQIIDILILGALLGWIVSSLTQKKKFFENSNLNIIIFILVTYTFISLLIGGQYLYGSYSFNISEERVKDWKNFCLMPLLFFINLNYFREKKWINRALLAMLLAIIVMDYYTLIQISSYSSLISREKIKGTFQFLGPNEVAAFFNEYTIILIAIFFFLKKKWIKWSLFILICINIFCILCLYSRGAYFGLFVGMGFIFSFKNKKLLILLILLALFWQSILPSKVVERIKETKGEYGQLDESSQRRINIWQQSLGLFQQYPLTGIGYGVFRSLGLDLGDTHNIYVKYLVEQGSVGITIFLIVLFCFFRMGFILYKKGDDDLSKGMGLGLMACIIVLTINNFFGDRWTYFELSAYLWIFAGFVGRLIIISKNTEPLPLPEETKQKINATPTITQKSKKKLRYYDI